EDAAARRTARPGSPCFVSLGALSRPALLLRSTARPAHHHAVLLDELGRPGMAVLVALHAAPRIALAVECVYVALLLGGAPLLLILSPAPEHATVMPAVAKSERSAAQIAMRRVFGATPLHFARGHGRPPPTPSTC